MKEISCCMDFGFFFACFVSINSVLYFGSDEGEKNNFVSLHGLSFGKDFSLHISLSIP